MGRTATMVCACLALAALALAGAPPEAEVQGMYEGTWKTGAGEGKLVARVVALGANAYKVFAIQHLPDDKTAKAEMDGKLDGDKVIFAGKDWSGTHAAGAVTGKIGADGSFEVKRIVPQSPTVGKKPPEGAVVLLDGKNFDQMTVRKDKQGKEPEWQVSEDDGSVQIPRRGMRTKYATDGSYDLHVEFMCPLRADKRSQGRGNSGVHLTCGQEIQVLDSFGMTTYKGGGCGGLYRWKDPDAFDAFSLASYPPLTWQTYDVEYRVKRDAAGKPTGKPLLTVYHNGMKIHDAVPLNRRHRRGGLSFQDHGNPVRYRNIWVLPIEEK